MNRYTAICMDLREEFLDTKFMAGKSSQPFTIVLTPALLKDLPLCILGVEYDPQVFWYISGCFWDHKMHIFSTDCLALPLHHATLGADITSLDVGGNKFEVLIPFFILPLAHFLQGINAHGQNVDNLADASDSTSLHAQTLWALLKQLECR